MAPVWSQELADQLGSQVSDIRSVSGGDINDAYRVTLEDGRGVFVKSHSRMGPEMFQAEAGGLRWLAKAQAIAIPQILAVGEQHGFLALSWVEPARKVNDFDERLGRGLAALHQTHAESFGWADDNFIGSLPQDNTPEDDWPTFYAKQRLLPLAHKAASSGSLPHKTLEGIETLCERLPQWVGDPEPPARLHGDLWGGNLMTDAKGEPCLIDPAVYGGHREIDLAMMQLFGGFSARVFDAYHDAYPLQRGRRERVGLYQLYPLLVHVNLFGGGYSASVERELRRYV